MWNESSIIKKQKLLRHRWFVLPAAAMMFSSCSGSGAPKGADFSGSADTPFTIRDERDLIGGPTAQGRVGDVLLANDKIRVIIQKPRKNAGVNSFGGNIIDADIVRQGGAPGQDNFGSIFPLVNVEWTVNYYSLEAISGGSGSGTKAIRARGKIDAYDYLNVNFIAQVAKGTMNQDLAYSNRFDDRMDPFSIYEDLKGLSGDVTTDYILEPGANYLKIETTFTNDGDLEAKFPVGQFINGSGQVSMLLPGVGFTPDIMTQVGGNTAALIYAGFDGVDVSYGYFFPAGQFTDPKNDEPYTTTSLTYSGVTGLLMGEEFLKLLPLGKGGTPEIHFSVPPRGSRKTTSYFAVGGGSAGSVLDAGLKAVGATARPVTGRVVDAQGKPVAGATVAVLSKGQTLITYRTDSNGSFAGNLPTGGDSESKRFGRGNYAVAVEMQSYHENGTMDAGSCTPKEIDVATRPSASVECRLGEKGTVALAGPVTDLATGEAIPARLTIVGEDPSPNKIGSAGRFGETCCLHLPDHEEVFGIAGVKYITAKGTFDMSGAASFDIEPGTYRFVTSRGVEYTADDRVVEVPAGGTLDLAGIKLARTLPTPGYISSDFHIHSIKSPDSALTLEMRGLSAAGEGMDILQSSDHDFLTDYAPVVARLVSNGLIPKGSLHTFVGDEITPNHIGHINAYPLTPDHEDPEGGAVHWSDTDREEISFAPDYMLTLGEIAERVRKDPGDEIVQINHIMDNPTGVFVASSWVTTPFYKKDFGVEPLSCYADPVEKRMPPRGDGQTSYPIALGASGLVTTDFDAVELINGQHLHDEGSLFRSSLPTWFNLLNLGIIVTATGDADTHRLDSEPIGMPRNFIASKIDPNDGMGRTGAIDADEFVANIRAHRVTVSSGPFLLVHAKSEKGEAEIGGTVAGRRIRFEVDVKAQSWAWFDTIDVYANTEPIPSDDKTDLPMQGSAADPAEFYKPYRIPSYTYAPTKSFRLLDGSLEDWKEEGGLISAKASFDLNVDEDTWVVVVARGTHATKGYRSLFPFVTRALVDTRTKPEALDPANPEQMHSDKKVGAEAWALANPIFIDADGDGFKAKYVREGISPIR